MVIKHDIIGEEWKTRAAELAEWAERRLINRRDVWGQYSVPTPRERRDSGRTYKAMTLPAKDQRGPDMVTLDKLTRHFASRRHRKPQLIGLHAKSKTTHSRWLGIDIDCHETESLDAADLGRRNLNAVVHWHRKLQNLGFDPLLFDSNGAGGYHLWLLFAEPAPTQQVFDFAQWIVSDWEVQQLEKLPETFPKSVKEDSIGSWFRLPGLHHTRDHYSAVWLGDDGLDDPWLTGHAAIDAMLSCIPGPPPLIPGDDPVPNTANKKSPAAKHSRKRTIKDAEPGYSPPPKRERAFKRTKRAKICVDLDGVLASRTDGQAIGAPVDGAVEFTRALAKHNDVIIYTARFSTVSGKPRSADATSKLEKRIIRWLDLHGFHYAQINTTQSKPIASAYVDDRAVPCTPMANGAKAFTQALVAVQKLTQPTD